MGGCPAEAEPREGRVTEGNRDPGGPVHWGSLEKGPEGPEMWPWPPPHQLTERAE